MQEHERREAQRVLFRESPLGKFAVEQLNGIYYINPLDPKGSPITLREKVGNLYPRYEELVLKRVRLLSIRRKLLIGDSKLMELDKMEEEEALISDKVKAGLLPEVRKRAQVIYSDWIRKKLDELEDIPRHSKRGMDPLVYLGDGSHRKDLGYHQSSEKKS